MFIEGNFQTSNLIKQDIHAFLGEKMQFNQNFPHLIEVYQITLLFQLLERENNN